MENFEIIEKYLLGKMSENEKTTFESRLQKDQDLRQETDMISDMIIGIEANALKNKLKGKTIGESNNDTSKLQEESSLKVVSKKSSSSILRNLAVAASFAAILIAGWIMLDKNSNAQSNAFAEVFYTDPGLPTPMSESMNYDFYDAMVDFKMEKYQLAYDKWSQDESTIGKDTLSYYIGMSLIELDKIEEAIDIINEIPENSEYYQKAKWQLLGKHLETEEYAKAKKLFETIPSTISPKHEVIKSFLETK